MICLVLCKLHIILLDYVMPLTPVRPNGPRIYSLAEPGIIGLPRLSICLCADHVALGFVLTGHMTSCEIRIQWRLCTWASYTASPHHVIPCNYQGTPIGYVWGGAMRALFDMGNLSQGNGHSLRMDMIS